MPEEIENNTPDKEVITEIPESSDVDKKEIQPAEEKPSYQQSNFKALRDIKAKVEHERDTALQELKELKQKNKYLEKEVYNDKEYIDETIPDETSSKIKNLEARLDKFTENSTELRLKAEYPDFYKVVSKENIEILRELHPEVGRLLDVSTNTYSKAVSAYTFIKKFGIQQDVTINKNKEIVQQNSLKPRPLASVSPQQGSGALSKANAFADGLTDDLKKKLYKEMLDITGRS